MKPELLIHPLPEAIAPTALAGGVVIVIDILRATTVIVHALANGARAVVPTGSIAQARQLTHRWPKEECRLGGERHGTRIEGFQFDNSPFSYTPDQVQGKIIVFTTTNGTRALEWAHQAAEIRIGAFSNLTALVASLQHESRPVHLLCAGTDQRISAEDLLFAGAVAAKLTPERSVALESRIYQEFWETHGIELRSRLQVLRDSAGGRNLIELGFDRDIDRAAQLDLFSVVPSWNPDTGELTVTDRTDTRSA